MGKGVASKCGVLQHPGKVTGKTRLFTSRELVRMGASPGEFL